jgi:hypothetical protein
MLGMPALRRIAKDTKRWKKGRATHTQLCTCPKVLAKDAFLKVSCTTPKIVVPCSKKINEIMMPEILQHNNKTHVATYVEMAWETAFHKTGCTSDSGFAKPIALQSEDIF